MKELIKKFLKVTGLYKLIKGCNDVAYKLLRKLTRVDQRLCKDYINNVEVKKLHIGCGKNYLSGWLNSDGWPESKRILRLDATKPYRFESGIFDYVFSEHMIEHVSYQKGQMMLSECFRVLKPGGILRIATPNLAFLICLYRNDKTEIQKQFIKHATDFHIKYAPNYEDTFVINNYMRDWGHQFIYDEKTLRYSFNKIGFVNISLFSVCESKHEVLKNLENIHRKPSGLLELESIVIEGTKP